MMTWERWLTWACLLERGRGTSGHHRSPASADCLAYNKHPINTCWLCVLYTGTWSRSPLPGCHTHPPAALSFVCQVLTAHPVLRRLWGNCPQFRWSGDQSCPIQELSSPPPSQWRIDIGVQTADSHASRWETGAVYASDPPTVDQAEARLY